MLRGASHYREEKLKIINSKHIFQISAIYRRNFLHYERKFNKNTFIEAIQIRLWSKIKIDCYFIDGLHEMIPKRQDFNPV